MWFHILSFQEGIIKPRNVSSKIKIKNQMMSGENMLEMHFTVPQSWRKYLKYAYGKKKLNSFRKSKSHNT